MTLDTTVKFNRLRFIVVSCFTSFNLVIGLLALFAATTGEITLAAWGLLLCVALDGCDGSLARRWKVATHFGAQLDSLADMTSFMVAGAGLVYYWALGDAPFWLICAVSGVYALAGALRLARFNTSTPSRYYFQGVPTTFATGVVAANALANPAFGAYGLLALVALLSVLMISALPYPKLAWVLRVPRWWLLVLLGSALINLPFTIGALSAIYLALGPGIWVYRRVRGTAAHVTG
jgi:CDP-diacylglycerol---serine O-phosphatidyltransferase